MEVVSFGDGEFVVGIDIPAGLYRALAPTDDCEWERRSADGVTGFGDASFLLAIVALAPSDVAFSSRGCGTWSNAPEPVATPGRPFGDGAFFVGAEIAPGRYRATGGSDACQWHRLHGFDAPYDRDLTTTYGGERPNVSGRGGHTVVDIAHDDVAFISSGCGVWSDDLSPVATPGEPFGDGVYILNVDIAPGRYRASTPESCYWFRLFTFGGEHSYGHGAWGYSLWPGDSSVVDIAPSDAGFVSRGCGTWSDALAAALTPGDPFGDGTWLVGIDIEPGRYFAHSPSERCRWYRLDGFGGEHTDGHYAADGSGWFSIVDIAASDAGFESSGCGTWTKEPPPPGPPVATFGDGARRVGIDIEPGRYFAHSPSENCYWHRLDGFGGYERQYLGIGRSYAWREPTLLAVADVAASDVGFASHGCGTWTAEPPAPRAPLGEAPIDGLLIVGHEVAPGRYRATLPETCTWRRQGSFEGTFGDAIGYDFGNLPLQMVDIAASDVGFYSRDCGWTADLTPVAVQGEPFGDGAYIVGVEVAPGRYIAEGFGETCRWTRLGKFGGLGGSDSSVLAERMVDGGILYGLASPPRSIVDIDPSDVGFASWGCGTWRPAPSRGWLRKWLGVGMYVVGSEVAPGHYRTSGRGCRWERLSGFGGTDEETIGRGYGPYSIVEIAPTDVGFYSGCNWGRGVADSTGTIPYASHVASVSFSDGTYRVGPEIAPGRYRVASPDGLGGFCWWARLSGFGGTVSEYVGQYRAGYNTYSVIVDIAASDAGFVSLSCGTWTRDPDPMLVPGDPLPEGAFLVGDEVEPGRYRQVTPTDRGDRACAWERVSGFGGTAPEVIASGGAPAGEEATVEIATTDTGFISYACGVWTKLP